MPPGSRILRVERHHLGPRLHVLGRRVHECHAGLAILAAAALAWIVRLGPVHLIAALAAVGGWLVLKDWRDLFPSRRDSSAWSPWIHRPRQTLRQVRRGDWLPPVLGGLAAAVGLASAASVLAPDLLSGLAPLRFLETPDMLGPLAPAVALPGGLALLVVARYLALRRRRAWALALVLLLLLGGLHLLRGVDPEEGLACWTLAGLLVWGREAFTVRHDPRSLLAAARWAPVAVLGALVGSFVAVWVSGTSHHPGRAARESVALLTLTGTPLHSADGLNWLPIGLGAVGLACLVWVAGVVFAPLAGPGPVDSSGRRAARRLVERHGTDTLSFFKLRRDLAYLFSPDGRAFLGYRIEGRWLLVAGDPVGAEEALRGLLRELFGFAEARGLRVAVVGAASSRLALYRGGGLRALYIGDEAIVDVRAFSLEGRPIRKVRQSVTRIERAGYRAEVRPVETLAPGELAELDALSERWRAGAPERGFSMAMDTLGGPEQAGSVVVVARDGEGAARGFLHLVPCPGRAAMSLSLMRRDRATPNGLTEFLVVRAIEALRERGVSELSLNFASFARLLREPRGPRQRIAARVLGAADARFQIERLYRFNAKFFPQWEPRYLLYEGALGLPGAGLAALGAEGQIPRLRMPRLLA